MVGLTGGVGSGKSTVARMLAEHGAVVIDADAIAREVVQSGTAGFDAVVAEFGDAVLAPDGELDRTALAALVFGDDARRAALNAIVHPLVGERVGESSAAAPEGAIVIYDVPLLVESGMAQGFEAVVVVEAPVALRLDRLAERGMPAQDARARMASQATDDQRREVSDFLVVNGGSLTELQQQVDEVWESLGGLERRPGIG